MLYRFLPLILALAASPAAAAQQRRGSDLPSEESTRHYLEGHISQYAGAAALAEARRAPSSIIALGAYGEFVTRVPAGILVRRRDGWSAYLDGPARPLPADVSREIDRLLDDPAFWRETFDPRQLCTGGARIMTVRHRGRVRTTRQSCGPSGVTGRLAEIAVSGRIPAPPPEARPDPSRRPMAASTDEREFPAQDPEVSRTIWERTQAAALAWNRGDLAGFLEPYSEDVAIVWPTGVEYHKSALRNRARSAQRWGGAPARRMELHSSMVRQLSPYSALQTYQIRFSGGGRPDTRMWVTSIWQNRRGAWEVTHEQTGAEASGHSR